MCDPIAQRLRKTRTTFADKTHNPAAQFIAGAGHLRATGTATAATSQRDQRGRTEWGLWNSGGCKRRDLLGRDGVEDVDVALVHHRELLRRRAHQRLRRRRRGGVAPAGSGGAIRRGWPGIVVVRRGLRRHRLGIGRWRCADGGGRARFERTCGGDGREPRTCDGGTPSIQLYTADVRVRPRDARRLPATQSGFPLPKQKQKSGLRLLDGFANVAVLRFLDTVE